jgi:hypothetical protein
VEAAIKLVAYKGRYFKDGWNVFDFIIVVGTGIGLLLKYGMGLDIGAVATAVRTFRVARILRIVKRASSLRILFATLVRTLPSLWNVGAILVLLTYIYSVLGVQLFANVKFGDALGPHANFQAFDTAFMTLIRASTGENWNGLMYDMADASGGCQADPEWDPEMCGFTSAEDCVPLDGCGSNGSFVYWVTFTTIITYVMLNLFIGVVLDGFGESSQDEYSSLSNELKDEFLAVWQKYDPLAQRVLKLEKLEKLVTEISPPMGISVTNQTRHWMIRQAISEMALPTFQYKEETVVLFTDVATALARRVFAAEKDDTDIDDLDDVMWEQILAKRPRQEKKLARSISKSMVTYERHYAISKLLLTFQTYKFRKALNKRVESNRVGHNKTASWKNPDGSRPLRAADSNAGGDNSSAVKPLKAANSNAGGSGTSTPKTPITPASAGPRSRLSEM